MEGEKIGRERKKEDDEANFISLEKLGGGWRESWWKRFRFPSGIYLYANTRYRDINQVRSQKDFRRSGDKNWRRRRVEGERRKRKRKGERGDGGRLDRWNDDPFPLNRISTALFSRWSRGWLTRPCSRNDRMHAQSAETSLRTSGAATTFRPLLFVSPPSLRPPPPILAFYDSSLRVLRRREWTNNYYYLLMFYIQRAQVAC